MNHADLTEATQAIIGKILCSACKGNPFVKKVRQETGHDDDGGEWVKMTIYQTDQPCFRCVDYPGIDPDVINYISSVTEAWMYNMPDGWHIPGLFVVVPVVSHD